MNKFQGRELWDKIEETDVQYVKSFDNGSFKGTAVDATYNVRRITEHLGPAGFNWGWEIKMDRFDTFGAGEDQQTVHTAIVRAWFRQEDGSKEYLEHVGQTRAAYWTRARRPGDKPRFVVDSEAVKKSTTDALSKIMVSLGASADIWLGRFDGNKYVAPSQQEAEENGHAKGNGEDKLLAHARDILQHVRTAATPAAVQEEGRRIKGTFGDQPFWPQLVHADRDLAAEIQSLLRGKAQAYSVDLRAL